MHAALGVMVHQSTKGFHKLRSTKLVTTNFSSSLICNLCSSLSAMQSMSDWCAGSDSVMLWLLNLILSLLAFVLPLFLAALPYIIVQYLKYRRWQPDPKYTGLKKSGISFWLTMGKERYPQSPIFYAVQIAWACFILLFPFHLVWE